MKKKLLLLAVVLMMGIGNVMAVPAHPKQTVMTQPDGSTVTIRLHGDEFLHFTTTDDGYTVVKDNKGYYVYARQEGGQLVPTAQVAHDAGSRTADEEVFLANVTKFLQPEMTSTSAEMAKRASNRGHEVRTARQAAQYDYSQFHGLLILVEYNDRTFSREDYAEILNDMVNQEDYSGYTLENGRKENYYGSVRDYYRDSSNGQFTPEFDIVGPVTVDYSQYAPQGTSNALKILLAALDAVDPEVDFSQYDGDGDGYVDLIYFIMAGNGANYGGNDTRLMWPHRSVIYNPYNYNLIQKDNVFLYDYACSVELQGFTSYPQSVKIDGIGTICHEFSHVLGLPDLYDSNYERDGQSHDPDEWSVMAGGCYLNDSKNPTSYSAYEKYFVGFIGDDDIPTIDAPGSFSLENVATSHTGYRINTPQNKEFFILENRQKTGWDAYLPGHGMLVFRVDRTNDDVWWWNTVNAKASHNYYELVRAGGVDSQNAATDPFPGRGQVTVLNNVTSPANLLSWAGLPCNWGLNNIHESGGIISFDVEDVNMLMEIKLPETMTVPQDVLTAISCEPVPSYAPHELTWSSDNPDVVTVDETGCVTGHSEGTAIVTVEDVSGLSASCTVTVFKATVADNIAAFKALDENEEAVLNLHDAQVVYLYSYGGEESVYVRDESGCIVFSNTGFGLSKNEVLNGAVYGKFESVNKMPRLLTVEGITGEKGFTRTDGEEAQPRRVRLSELTDDDLCDFVTLTDVRVTTVKENNSSYAMAVDEDASAFIYNLFKIKDLSMPKGYETKLFDITGIYGTRLFQVGDNSYSDIYPTEKMKVVGDAPELAVTAVEYDSTTESVYYTLDGCRVKAPTYPGIYLVKHGERMVKVVKR